MPKQNASEPPHRPVRRKSKPKFDVPAGVGEPSSASWVYREDVPEIPAAPPLPPVAAIAETIAAPIAAAIEATAALEPEPVRPAAPPAEPVADAFASPMYESSARRSTVAQSPMLRLFAAGLGVMEFFASTAINLITAPMEMARRRLMS